MRITPSTFITSNISNTTTVLRTGQIIRAKIESFENSKVLLKLLDGSMLKAGVKEGLSMPKSGFSLFQIVSTDNGIVEIKQILQQKIYNQPLLNTFITKLNLEDTPYNRTVLSLMMMCSIVIDNESFEYFKKRNNRISKTILQLIKNGSLKDIDINRLVSLLPNIDDLPELLKDNNSSLRSIYWEILGLICDIDEESIDSTQQSKYIKDILMGLMLQDNSYLPFEYLQIPIRSGKELLNSEVWISKNEDQLLVEIELPTAGFISCRLYDWEKSPKVTLYIDKKETMEFVDKNSLILKQRLSEVFNTNININIDSNIDSGFIDFLSEYRYELNEIDIKI